MEIDKERVILLSINPNFAEDILNGSKKWEYRKTPPKLNIETRMVLYASQTIQSVVGDCIVKKVLHESLNALVGHTIKETTSSKERLERYFEGLEICSALRVEEPRRYTKSISLGEIRTKIPGFMPPQSFYYLRRNDPRFEFLFKIIDSADRTKTSNPEKSKSF